MNEPVNASVRDSIRTEIRIRGHSLLADEPAEKGGGDEGPTPTELFLAGLAACTAMTLRMYANVKEWPLQGVDVSASLERVREEGREVFRISLDLGIRGDLDESQLERLHHIARRCPVHRTVTENPEVSHHLHLVRE